ncbi:glycosyltransferase [Clostridium bornimense]|uniref:glycosyltransferase n=1 Tax=Clostridium bornimense TaxID=1216932 RepID=UPI001C10B2C4|nr:glycosyltransferase [Clostridium bornimense]MBU5315059.1 glycosyltransferase [Clostridium bornimense]
MKILLITSLYPCYKDQPKSEITYAVHYFVREWIRMNHEVIVINTRRVYPKIISFLKKGKKANEDSTYYNFEIDGVKVYRMPIIKYPKGYYSKYSIKSSINSIEKVMRDNNFNADVILSHMINPGGIVALNLKKKIDKPCIITFHYGDILFLNNKGLNNFNKLEKYVDGYGFRSDSIKKNYLSIREKYNKPDVIVRSGIDRGYILDEKAIVEKSKKEIKKVIVVSSLIKRKNIDCIIKAIVDLNKEGIILSLIILGEGEEEVYLKELVEQLNAGRYITFIKEVDREEVFMYLEEANIFAMISERETLGLVYLEAMAKGCITIASKGEGVDGIIKDNVNGFLCKGRDVEELKNIIKKIIQMRNDDVKKMLLRARNDMYNLSSENVALDYLEFISNVINEYSRNGEIL